MNAMFKVNIFNYGNGSLLQGTREVKSIKNN